MSDDDKKPAGVDVQQVIVEDKAIQTKAEAEQSQAAEEFGRQEAGGKHSMSVKVYSPFRDYYDGQAFSISAVNDTGPFDILPKHHNFISLLSPCDLIVRTVKEGDDRKIRISGGIMHVKADRIIVFLDV